MLQQPCLTRDQKLQLQFLLGSHLGVHSTSFSSEESSSQACRVTRDLEPTRVMPLTDLGFFASVPQKSYGVKLDAPLSTKKFPPREQPPP